MRRMQLLGGMIGFTLFLGACDKLEDDVVPTTKLTIPNLNELSDEHSNTYNSSGGEVRIDLLRGLEASQRVRIALDKAPTRGEAELLDEGILRYVPYPDFTTGRDWMVVALSSGTSSRQDTIEIVMNPLRDTVLVDTVVRDSSVHCTGLIVNDDFFTLSDSISPFDYGVYYLDVLANDQLCSLSYQLVLSTDNPALAIENNQIRYTSPGQEDISFSYSVCRLDHDECQEGQVDVQFASCVPNALYDSVFVNHEPFTGADTVMIDVRRNDQVCDDTPITIYQGPSRGRAWVEDNQIMYEYTIEPGESFGTELKYDYDTTSAADSVSWAPVSIEVRTQ